MRRFTSCTCAISAPSMRRCRKRRAAGWPAQPVGASRRASGSARRGLGDERDALGKVASVLVDTVLSGREPREDRGVRRERRRRGRAGRCGCGRIATGRSESRRRRCRSDLRRGPARDGIEAARRDGARRSVLAGVVAIQPRAADAGDARSFAASAQRVARSLSVGPYGQACSGSCTTRGPAKRLRSYQPNERSGLQRS